MELQIPSVINDRPTHEHTVGYTRRDIVIKVMGNIYTRCRLAEAQNWKCCWCGKECNTEPNHHDSATIEHVTPRSFGGSDDWDNLAMACAACNHRRGTHSVEDMLEGRIPPKGFNKKSQTISRYIQKAHRRNKLGWVNSSGEPIDKDKWLESLRLKNQKHVDEVKGIIYSDS